MSLRCMHASIRSNEFFPPLHDDALSARGASPSGVSRLLRASRFLSSYLIRVFNGRISWLRVIESLRSYKSRGDLRVSFPQHFSRFPIFSRIFLRVTDLFLLFFSPILAFPSSRVSDSHFTCLLLLLIRSLLQAPWDPPASEHETADDQEAEESTSCTSRSGRLSESFHVLPSGLLILPIF